MKKKYYIIFLEEKAREGTLLFWRSDEQGYTSALEEAGLFEEEFANLINQGRDIALTKKHIALTKKQLEKICFMKIYTVVDCPFKELFDKKEEISGI